MEVVFQISVLLICIVCCLAIIVSLDIKQSIENKNMQNLISQAVLYAEQTGKEFYKKNKRTPPSRLKLTYAKDFIHSIEPKILFAYEESIDDMIASSVAKEFGVNSHMKKS